MPKNKLSEIDEILAKSQRLAASFTDRTQSTRNLSRGILELNEATKQFTQTSTRDQQNADSFTILNQKTKKLYDDVNAIMFDVRDSVDPVESMDLDAYLNHHEELSVLRVIDESNKLADESVQEMQKRWAADEWATAKTKFMESLGHRSYQWEGNGNTTIKTNTAGDPSVYEGHGHNNSSLTVFNTPAVRTFTPSSSSAQGSGNNFNVNSLMTRNSSMMLSSTPSRAATSTSYLSTPGSTTIAEALGRLKSRPAHSDFLNAHTQIVREMQLKAHEKSPRRIAPCAELSSTINVPQHLPAKGIVTDGLTKADLVSYKALLNFLSSVVGESELGPEISPGHYSSVAFDAGECYVGLQEKRRAQLTAGAKSYLEEQIYEIWSRAVDAAVTDGELSVSPSTEGSTRQQRLKAYVSYQYRVGVIPSESGKVLCPQVAAPPSTSQTLTATQTSRVLGGYAQSALVASTSRLTEPLREGAVPLWAYVYHCLRVGDLSGAQSELTKCANLGYRAGETEAAATLKALIAVSSSTQNKSTGAARSAVIGATDAAKRTLVESVSHCRALYDSEMSSAASEQNERDVNNSRDPYRLVVLNLLGLADRDALANSPVQGFSLEDFLWAHLWFVQVTQRSGGSSNSGETDLFELIQSYGGAEYFDQDRSTPFKYATVLFCCQRYGDAVAHLWATNKTVPAVHLMIICLYYGLVLPHSPLSQNPGHPLVNNRVSTSGGTDPTPATVLQVFFSSNVFQHYPELATDYLVSLDSNWLPAAEGLEAELREVHKLRSQATFSAAMEAFILKQDIETLAVIAGKPLSNEELGREVLRFRTQGRLDDYLQIQQIDLLLSRSAYYLLTQRRESEGAIYLYQLAGRYSDVLDEMCTQLSEVLVPPSLAHGQQAPTTQLQQHQQQQLFATQQAVREHWRQLADSFIQKYLRGANNTHSPILYRLTQSGHQELAEELITLHQLFKVVDAFCAQQFDQAMEILDGLNVLPTSDSAIEVCAKTQPHVLRVLDDLIILSAESSRAVFQQLRLTRGTVVPTSLFGSGHLVTPLKSRSGDGQGLLTDKDIRMQSLTNRVRTLVTFANRMKGKLNRQDTSNIVARIEATFL